MRSWNQRRPLLGERGCCWEANKKPQANSSFVHNTSFCRSCYDNRKAQRPQKRHKSHLLASHNTPATAREQAAYLVSLSSLSTWRMCSITGRVYSTATTKLKDPRNVTSLFCLHPMIRGRRQGNRQHIQSLCHHCQPGGCAVQPGEYIPPLPQSSRTPETSGDVRAAAGEPAVYPVPLSSQSNRRMWSIVDTRVTELRQKEVLWTKELFACGFLFASQQHPRSPKRGLLWFQLRITLHLLIYKA